MNQSNKQSLTSPASPTSSFEHPDPALPPFGRAISRGPGTNDIRRKEHVPRPRSAVVLGLTSPLSTADQNLRRFHTEPHVATSVSFATAPIPVLPDDDQQKESKQRRHPWRVTKVPPAIYPIERTHEVLHHVPPLVVADRVAACLRELSIGAAYDHRDAICRAELDDLTRFNIRLFGDNDDIILELQRRSGSSLTFHNAAQIILLSAKGRHPKNPIPKGCSPCWSLRAAKYRCCHESKAGEEGRRVSEDGSIEGSIRGGDLAMVDCLLRKNMLDARLLAMESLRYLTDENSSGADTSTAVAQVILCGSDEQSVNIRDALFSLVVNGTLDNDGCNRCPCDCGIIDDKYNHAMHETALVVLANALGILLKDGRKDPGKLVCCSEATQELLVALCEDIADAEEKPTDAYQALRCMFELVQTSNSAKLDAKSRGVLTLIEAMQGSGICHHRLMEEELKKTEEILR